MIYILTVRILTGKLFYLLKRKSFSFQIMSETVYKYIYEIFELYVLGVGSLTPRIVPGGGVLYTMIVPGEGFLPPSSCVPGACSGWGMVLDETDSCIRTFKNLN